MELRLDDATRDDVSRALEVMLAAGLSLSRDVTQDPTALTDAYWWSLRGSSKASLQKVLEETLQFGGTWIPAANELRRRCWEIDNPKRLGQSNDPKVRHDTVARANHFDDDGPCVRVYAPEEKPHLPIVTDTRCPIPNCECDPVEVWLPAAAFGGPTKGWGIRWVWGHVALEKKLKRTMDWHPIKGDLR
jgi:hypothetical protein